MKYIFQGLEYVFQGVKYVFQTLEQNFHCAERTIITLSYNNLTAVLQQLPPIVVFCAYNFLLKQLFIPRPFHFLGTSGEHHRKGRL